MFFECINFLNFIRFFILLITDCEFVLKVKKKRPGDVAYLVCNNKKIKKLGWKPKYKNLDNCLNESYKYFRKHFFLKN